MDRRARFSQWWREWAPGLAALFMLYLSIEAIRLHDRSGLAVMGLVACVGAYAIVHFFLSDWSRLGISPAERAVAKVLAEPQSAGEPFKYAFDAYLRRDYGAVIQVLESRAEKGEAKVQFILGGAYHASQNYTDAMKWYRRAAEQGYADAQINLAEMYFTGRGAPQSYVQALSWFILAANNVATGFGKTYYDAIHKRDLVAGKMTAAQIAEAQRLASEWEPEADR
jgi:tetratricopeptide (TPR) repeat protein